MNIHFGNTSYRINLRRILAIIDGILLQFKKFVTYHFYVKPFSMKKIIVTLSALFALFFTTINAQTEYLVLLHSGNQVWTENTRTYADEAFISAQETVDGKYYRFLQFYEIPNQDAQKRIAEEGIELLEYVPNKAYIASIPVQYDVNRFSDLNVRSIMPIVPSLKTEAALQSDILPEWALKRNEIHLVLKYYKNLNHEDILRYCEKDGIEVTLENGYNNFLKIRISKDHIEKVAALPYVAFLEAIPEPSTPDDTEARSLHRANTIDSQYPTGRHYTGEGVSVLCRDDGDIGPHIDFQGRLNSDFVGGFGGTHGDGVSGIMSGAGNLNPKNRGNGAGTTLYATNYEETFLDETMMLFFDHNVIVTNSSYSNGCNAGYTGITQTVDDQVFQNPTLLHVFSAGNSNNNDCGYGAGNQWGNITGGHKQGKNVIATANIANNADLVNSSSRGPAHDGRIKPDIAANGAQQISTDPNNSYEPFGGTSGAAPNIAGITAMLHEAYREMNNGETASSGLLKPVLLNTANDLGRKGPDFEFGWGHVNALRAITTLEDGRYFSGTIMQGDTNTHTITIPDGVVLARVMTYWMDPSGTVMTNKALVNDLDTKMIDTEGTEYLPWWLDPTPNPTILSTPATTGEDHLNNVEQISIDNPIAGDYTLQISGFEVPFGAHDYVVVWEFRTEEIDLIYPIGGENLVPGEVERVHWEAEGTSGSFELYFSSNGGSTWDLIGQEFGSVRQFNWTVPNTITGSGLFRIVRGTQEDMSKDNFSIALVPFNLSVVEACPTYIRLAWDPLVVATSYNVYMLGDKYMELIANTNSTIFDIPIDNPLEENWFAVGMQEDNLGAIGRRTIAIPYSGGLLGCILDNDVGLVEINSPSTGNITACGTTDSPISVTITNGGIVDQGEVVVSYQVNDEVPIEEMLPDTLKAGETTNYTFIQSFSATSSGEYTIKTWASIAGDEAAFNDTATVNISMQIYPGDGEPIAYSEGFEGVTFLPDFYSITNPDEDVTWDSNMVTGIDGNMTTCLWVHSYIYQAEGEEDYMTTIPIDLINANSAILNFDVANARFNDQWNDGLRVEISSDCGFSFNDIIYEKFNTNLATIGDQTNDWRPTSGDHWRKETIDLTPYIGNSVVLRFTCINGYGSNLFLDNINIDVLAAPTADFTIDGNIFCPDTPIEFQNTSVADFATYEWDFGASGSPMTSTDENPSVSFSAAGTYPVTLTTTNAAGSDMQTMDITIDPLPTPAFSIDQSGGTITLTNSSTDAQSYSWNFGDAGTSTDTEPIYSYNELGSFTVTLTVTNSCGSAETTQTVDITVGVNDPNLAIHSQLLPNPTSDQFEVILSGNLSDELTINLMDLRGVVLQSEQVIMNNNSISQRFDVSDLASGVYFLKIQGRDGFLTRRIIVE